VALIHPDTNSFELVNSGNRDASGACYSGLNPCRGGDSISPAIRLDPSVLHAWEVSQAVVAIATKDYSALSGILDGPAEISVWRSPEKPAAYQKGQPFTVTENSLADDIALVLFASPRKSTNAVAANSGHNCVSGPNADSI
jgi:hypothetical protein